MPITASLLSLLLLAFAAPCGIVSERPELTRLSARGNVRPQELPDSVRITRTSDFGSLAAATSRYTVECRVVSERLSFSPPAIAVQDGERATVSDTRLARYVVGAVHENGTRLPIVREIPEGSTFEWTVIGVEDGQIVLDISLELQGTDAESLAGNTASLRTKCIKIRAIERTAPGLPIAVPFDGGRLEAVVRHAASP